MVDLLGASSEAVGVLILLIEAIHIDPGGGEAHSLHGPHKLCRIPYPPLVLECILHHRYIYILGCRVLEHSCPAELYAPGLRTPKSPQATTKETFSKYVKNAQKIKAETKTGYTTPNSG